METAFIRPNVHFSRRSRFNRRFVPVIKPLSTRQSAARIIRVELHASAGFIRRHPHQGLERKRSCGRFQFRFGVRFGRVPHPGAVDPVRRDFQRRSGLEDCLEALGDGDKSAGLGSGGAEMAEIR